MKRSKFTEEQIAFALKQAESGVTVAEVCRKMGVSENTYYAWKKKFSGLGVSELRQLRQLEEENRKLKQLVADLSLDKAMLQDVLSKKVMKPAGMRKLVLGLQESYWVSERRAVKALGAHRSAIRYRPKRPALDAPIRKRIKEIAAVRIRYGYRRIHTLLQREGWSVNLKRVYRTYCLAGLDLRSKRPKRRRMASHRIARPDVTSANDCWSMDFVSDALFNGKRFRALTVMDQFTRECLTIYADQHIKGEQVVSIMCELAAKRGVPKRLQTDNGSEFVSKALDKWAYKQGVTMDFSRPGRPTDNPFIESFNGSFRDECLNIHWFLSLQDAREKIETWRVDYNQVRPHSALGDLPPRQFAQQVVGCS